MTLKIVFASVIALAFLAPSVGLAQEGDRQAINTSRSNIKHQGISVIDPNDAASVELCKALGGKVEKRDDETICNIPIPATK